MDTRNQTPWLSDGEHRDCRTCLARQMSVCANIDQVGLGKLQAMSRPALFTKGRVVFEQDSPLDQVFLITGGMVKLFRLLADGGRQITGFLGPGDLLGGIKRSAGAYCTAQAIVDVTACVFPRASFLRLLQEYPDLCFSLLITATDEIEAHNDHIILLGHRRVPQRLAAFLLVMGHRWKTNGADGTVVQLPMARTDIADYLGLTIETVSRAFAEFKRLGYIALPKPNRAVLLNLPALYELAGFEDLPTPRVALGL